MGIFGTTYDHLLEWVPFVVTANRTFLLYRLSTILGCSCRLRIGSRLAGNAPKGPSSHRPADLRSKRLLFQIFSRKPNSPAATTGAQWFKLIIILVYVKKKTPHTKTLPNGIQYLPSGWLLAFCGAITIKQSRGPTCWVLSGGSKQNYNFWKQKQKYSK